METMIVETKKQSHGSILAWNEERRPVPHRIVHNDHDKLIRQPLTKDPDATWRYGFGTELAILGEGVFLAAG